MAKLTKEQGVAGNTSYTSYGQLDTGEYLAKLTGQEGLAVYDEMRRSDPQVGAVLRSMTLPIRQATYYVEPASDDKKDVEIAEIIQENLFHGMTMLWDDVIRHALLMLPFGFSILEKVYEYNPEESMYKLRKLDPRLPISVSGWNYNKEKKQLIGPIQTDTDGKEYQLTIDKILIFTAEREGDNWEGISVLRNAYKPWWIKQRIEKINAIRLERHGVGIPVAEIPDGVKRTDEAWGNTEKMLEELSANEKGYVILPNGYKLNLLGQGGDKAGADGLPTIKYCDDMIARTMLAMFLNLGTTDTGSRALGISFIDVFMKCLQAVAEYICEVISRYAIREYCDINWGVKQYPILRVAKIKDLDISVITDLTKAGLLTPDDNVENVIRGELNLPKKKKDDEKKPDNTVDDNQGSDDGEPQGNDNQDDMPPEGEIIQVDKMSFQERMKAFMDNKGAKFQFRNADLRKEELIPDFMQIEMKLNSSQRVVINELISIRKNQALDIIDQVIKGKRANNIRVLQKKQMFDYLMKEFKKQIRAGREEVREELKQQKQTLADDKVEPADYSSFVEWQEEKMAIQTEGAADKLKTTILTLYLLLRRQGLEGDDLERGMLNQWEDKVGIATWKKMASSAVNGGWGAGRTIEAEKQRDKIDYAYYSAVLDQNTCVNCEVKDGHSHEVNDPGYATPNPDCLGDDYCRCITIYVLKE